MRETDKDRSKREPLTAGELVDHYKVVRLVGQGGTGEVYLARDTHLGRRVALKLVHLPREDDAEGRQQALEDFLSEARITARFNHPHIVTVHGVGQHQDHPYVALEYLEGQSLRLRLREERPGLKESARIGLAIADALAEAHRNQVLHRDLKPENVMLPRDGRLRVVDFGLATAQAGRRSSAPPAPTFADDALDSTLHGSPGSAGTTQVVGTPRYIAPEVWKDQSFATASDIWALGLILCELFSGRHPYSSLTRFQLYQQVCSASPVPAMQGAEELPAELVALVSRCVDKDPERRASARAVADGLRRFLALTRLPLPEEVSPFRGLLPFTERDADMFFGRDDEIGAFLERLRVTPVLPVVGPSGAGKSSFVQAGVMPRLRDRGHWITLLMRPGQDPFRALAGCLYEAGGFLEETTAPEIPTDHESDVAAMEALAAESSDSSIGDLLASQLQGSPGRLSLSLQQIAEEQRGRVLLIVDQLEELYTLVEDEEVRRGFMRAICTAADDEQAPVRVIFTLRDDFHVRLAETAEAREVLGQVTVLRTPGPDALRRILTKPLQRVGYRYDSEELVERMIRAIQGEMAGLPVLQFALSQLWERRDRERQLLDSRAYDEMGGVEGALAGHADGILSGMTPAQVGAAREIFLRLITAQGTRRIASSQGLLEGLGPEAALVLDILIRERVVLTRRAQEEQGLAAELELVHESLISNWRRLARWIEESKEEIAFLAEIGQAAELWERRGRSNHEVWRGPTLQEAEIKITRCSAVPGRVQAFMDASRRLARRRVRRRRIAVATVMIALAVVGIVFAVKEREVRRQREVAETQWERAEIRGAEAQREGALAALVRGDLLEARAKLRRSLETRDSTLARILWWRLSDNPLIWRHQLGAVIYGAAFSPDGTTVAAAAMDTSIYLFDIRTKSAQILRGHGDQIFAVAFSPDGRHLAAGSWGGDVWLWDLQQNRANRLKGHENGVWAVAFNPDGTLIASAGLDGKVRLWDGRTGADRGVIFSGKKRVWSVTFSPDGRLLAVGSCDNKVRLIDIASGREIRVMEGHEGCVSGVGFGSSGKLVVSSSSDKTIRIWDAATGAQLRILEGHTARIYKMAIDPSGKLAASGGGDRAIRVWDLASGESIRELHGHTTIIRGLDFSPDGRLLVSGGIDSTVRIWDVTTPVRRDEPHGHTALVDNAQFSFDGKLVASVGQEATIRIRSVETGAAQAVLRGHDDSIAALAFSPDGATLATGGEDTTIVLWNLATGEQVGQLTGHTATVNGAVFTRDCKRLITAGGDGTIRIWDIESGTQKQLIRGHDRSIMDLALGPDEKTLASGSTDGTVRIWDVRSGAKLGASLNHEKGVYGVGFSPDGRLVVSGSADRTVRLWDTGTGIGRILGRHDSRVYRSDFHPDGERVGSSSADGTARIWNIETGDWTTLRGHRGEINVIRFDRGGDLAVTAGDDGTVRLWDVETGHGVWRAPVLIGDPPQLFTHTGWIDLSSSSAARVGDATWRRAIADRARQASSAPGSGPLCIATHDEAIQLWDTSSDTLAFEEHLSGLNQVLALPTGCLALANGKARLFSRDGSSRELVSAVTAAALSRDRILLAAGEEVRVFSTAGEQRASYETNGGATALARVGDWLVLGYTDGSIELVPTVEGAPKPGFVFEQVPSSPVVRLVEGPMGTVVAGYANGLWGIWNLENGARLYDARMHGPVVHLLLQQGKLYAASELGQYSVLDVSMFDREYCELLREVWDKVPVTWESGLPVLSAPPDDHPCRRSDK